MSKYIRCLTIAGSDCGGGAGIQADLKTFSALGCYGMSAITALTAQNTIEVRSVFHVPPKFIAEQIDVLLDDIGVDAIKIGMLANKEVIEVVADRMKKCANVPLVVDPVMISKSGHTLLPNDAIQLLSSALLPLATLITPNLEEAEKMTRTKIETRDDMAKAGRALTMQGARAVLIKGGHLRSIDSPDCLIEGSKNREVHWIEGDRIDTMNTHGTGCTLSAAIAAYLAKGSSLLQAVVSAKRYLSGAIHAGARYSIGKGNGPVLHFYGQWENC